MPYSQPHEEEVELAGTNEAGVEPPAYRHRSLSYGHGEKYPWWVFSPEPFRPNIQILPLEPASVDDVLEYIGGFGPYQQKVTFSALFVPWVAAAFQSISTVFSTPELPTEWFSESAALAKQEKGLIVIMYFIGWAVGCSLAGHWGDVLGRRTAFWRMCWLQTIGGLLTAIMPEYYTYILARAITGMGVGGFGIVGWVLASEFWANGHRNAIACIAHTPYAVGLALFAAIAWVLPTDWRMIALVATTGTWPTILFMRSEVWIPESPRWLLSKNRIDEAVQVLEMTAEQSGKPLPNGWVLQGALEETPRATQQEVKTVGLAEIWGYPKMAFRLAAMCAMWFATSFGYYGLIYNADSLAGDPHLSSILGALMEIPAYFACVWVLQKLGRKYGSTFFLGTIGVACSCVLLTGIDSPYVMLFAMIGKFGAAGSFDVVYIYATEMFPTEIRNLSMGFASMFARFGVLVAQPIIGIGGVLPMACFGVVCLATAFVSLWLPETLDKPMWETIAEAMAAEEGRIELTEEDCTAEVDSREKEESVTFKQIRDILGEDALAKIRKEVH